MVLYKLGTKRKESNGHIYTLLHKAHTHKEAEQFRDNVIFEWKHTLITKYVKDGKDRYLVWGNGKIK